VQRLDTPQGSSPTYADDGCPDGLFPSCLGCPLPRCRFTLPGERFRRVLLVVQVALLCEEGFAGDVATIARRLGVSRRAAYRYRSLAQEMDLIPVR
jgi:hypothetical protein